MVALILGYGDLTVYLVMGEGALNILHDRRGFRGEVKVVWGLYTIEHNLRVSKMVFSSDITSS